MMGKMNKGFSLDHLNTYDRNIKFTWDIEIANKIAYLDVSIIHSIDKLIFTIDREPAQDKS